jgi:hypothetical protein
MRSWFYMCNVNRLFPSCIKYMCFFFFCILHLLLPLFSLYFELCYLAFLLKSIYPFTHIYNYIYFLNLSIPQFLHIPTFYTIFVKSFSPQNPLLFFFLWKRSSDTVALFLVNFRAFIMVEVNSGKCMREIFLKSGQGC